MQKITKEKNKYCSKIDLARDVLSCGITKIGTVAKWGFECVSRKCSDTDQTKCNHVCYLATNQNLY